MTGRHPAITAIHARRSRGEVAPDPLPREIIEDLLASALAAPNHHRTTPWRFIVLTGMARRRAGEAHLRAVQVRTGALPPEGRRKEASRFERAPTVVVCLCRTDPADPVRAREDRDAVAAGVQNMLIAAEARGLAAIWRTGTMPDEEPLREELGLERTDAIVGLVYIGRPAGDPPPAVTRPAVADVTTWRAD